MPSEQPLIEQLGFDDVLLGMLYRRERTNRGYKSVEDFLRAVSETTGASLSKDTYYRFEKGTTRISVGDLMAINITLFGRMDTYQFWNIVRTSAPASWQKIEDNANYSDQMERLSNL